MCVCVCGGGWCVSTHVHACAHVRIGRNPQIPYMNRDLGARGADSVICFRLRHKGPQHLVAFLHGIACRLALRPADPLMKEGGGATWAALQG